VHLQPRKSQAEILERKPAAADQLKLFCKARPILRKLSDSEGWRALEEGMECRSVGHTARIFIGQRCKQAQRRDDSNKEKRQNRQPIRAATCVAMREQQANKSDSDYDGRNQKPDSPLPILNHR
jgi:hypothetical protein